MRLGFCGEKGGLGKTTLALCVAGELARRGRRVLVLDCDENQHTAVRWATIAEARGGLTFDVAQRSLAQIRPSERFEHEVVIFDLPGHRSPVVRAVAPLTELLVMPVTASFEAWSVEPTLALAKAAQSQLRVVLTRTRPGQRFADTAAALRKELQAAGVQLLKHSVRDLSAFREALLAGRLPAGSRERSAVQDIEQVTSEIVAAAKRSSRPPAQVAA